MEWTDGQLADDDARFMQLGQVIDGYRIEGKLGQSAHGVSYYARRVTNESFTWNAAMAPEMVTLKALWSPIGLRNKRARAAFHDQFARQTTGLRTYCGILIPSAAAAGAAQFITSGGAPDHPYVIRSYVDGYSLANRLADQPQGLPLSEVAYYTTRAAAALDYAHAHGITHGAVTLENALVSRDRERCSLTLNWALACPRSLAPLRLPLIQ